MRWTKPVLCFIGAALLPLATPQAHAQVPAAELKPVSGDAPADPGPLATDLSPKLDRQDVRKAMRKVADWQLTHLLDQDSRDWTYATLYVGMLSASDTLEDPRYRDHVRQVAEHYNWTLGPRLEHADDQAIGQSYLWLYLRQPDPHRIAAIRTQFDALMQQPDDPAQPVWWWCDALFMAPPVWANLARATGNSHYLAYMHHEWHVTDKLLWDPQEHLFFRDKSYFEKREKNGRKVFWSRGNGWVMGGLARILEVIPPSDPERAFYVERFRQMAAAILPLQGQDGLWRPGLLDAADYPYPEDSGSAFFTYALAYGINHGLLPAATYRPLVDRAWAGLLAHIYADGRLGDIQPVGAAPGAYTPGSSHVFGVGAFLMAGSEIDRMVAHPSPAKK